MTTCLINGGFSLLSGNLRTNLLVWFSGFSKRLFVGLMSNPAGSSSSSSSSGNASEANQNWDIPRDGSTHLDPLLDSLVTITRIHGRPCSADALRHGLPLKDGKLTAELFIRAAARGGFSARLVKTSLKKISNLVTPVVLLLKGRKACTLVSVDRKKADSPGYSA